MKQIYLIITLSVSLMSACLGQQETEFFFKFWHNDNMPSYLKVIELHSDSVFKYYVLSIDTLKEQPYAICISWEGCWRQNHDSLFLFSHDYFGMTQRERGLRAILTCYDWCVYDSLYFKVNEKQYLQLYNKVEGTFRPWEWITIPDAFQDIVACILREYAIKT